MNRLMADSGTPAWLMMWVLAGVLFAGAKVLTLRAAPGKVSCGGALSYLFLWVGMNPREFFRSKNAAREGPIPIAPGVVKILVGATLLWGVAPLFTGVAAGWVGMAGMVLLLHFGVFHLLARFWQERGVYVQPIMNEPLRARTLAEFWGERWNRAFNELMYAFVFRRAINWTDVSGATLLVFAASGLIHDLVISLPAGGGYGLPSAYFVLQGTGLLLQRTAAAKKRGWSRGLKGRLLTAVVLIVPLPLLFHTGFINGVILPFMGVIGAEPVQRSGGFL